jgi:aminoglycoside phosphotransferase (APT) family kinase protein
MARILAKLHTINLTGAELPDPLRGRTPQGRFIHKVDVYWNKWRNATPEPSPLVEFAFGWVKQESLGSGLGAPSIVHGDFGPHNALCSNGRITGVVDWELVDIGDPAEDLAFCRSSVEKLMAWNEFLDIYYSYGGRRVDERRLKLFTVFGALKGLAFCGRMERTFLDGRVPGFAYGASAFAIMRSLQWQLATALQSATGISVEELTS